MLLKDHPTRRHTHRNPLIYYLGYREPRAWPHAVCREHEAEKGAQERAHMNTTNIYVRIPSTLETNRDVFIFRMYGWLCMSRAVVEKYPADSCFFLLSCPVVVGFLTSHMYVNVILSCVHSLSRDAYRLVVHQADCCFGVVSYLFWEERRYG